MCGIVGICGSWYSAGTVQRMTARLAHRGPDGEGAWEDAEARLGLGHVRLSVLDLSEAAHQPMVSGQCVLSYNGEIYNFRELREELERDGDHFTSTGDSEVLLRGLMRHGADFIPRLNGMFAFAYWDGRELLLARDQLGIKPLYIADQGRGIAFASELKALLGIRGLSRRLNPAAIHGYLAHLWATAPATPLIGIEKLEPGTLMVVADGKVQRRSRYYELPYGREPLAADEPTIVEQLRGELARAVERQMVSDVPLGAFLSGGLDSSAVVALMRAVDSSAEIPCYTISLRDRNLDGFAEDLPYARQVAQHLKVDLTEIEINAGSIDRLPEMLYYLDEPQADPAPINAMLISEQARRDGMKVLMSGAGGDDIFSGYRRHHLAMLDERYRQVPGPVRAVLARAAEAINDGDIGLRIAAVPMLRRALKALVGFDKVGDRRLASYFLWSSEKLRRSLYTAEMAQSVQSVDTDGPMLDALARVNDETDPLNRLLFLEAKFFLADHNLNYTDKVGMASGIEARVPLIDVDLVDFVTRIPAAFKQQGSTGKAIFKKAMEPYLPRGVIYRPKTGFGAPLRHWLHNELRPLVDEIIGSRTLRERGIFDPAAVRRMVDLDRSGRIDVGYVVFSIICIELWCRMFIDDENIASLNLNLAA